MCHLRVGDHPGVPRFRELGLHALKLHTPKGELVEIQLAEKTQMSVRPCYTAQFDFRRIIEFQLFCPGKSEIIDEQLSQIQSAADLKIFLARPEVPIPGCE